MTDSERIDALEKRVAELEWQLTPQQILASADHFRATLERWKNDSWSFAPGSPNFEPATMGYGDVVVKTSDYVWTDCGPLEPLPEPDFELPISSP